MAGKAGSGGRSRPRDEGAQTAAGEAPSAGRERATKGARPLAAGGQGGPAGRSTLPEKGARSLAAAGKAPRTQRGARTLRRILDSALAEFGARGFGETSIVGITSRAGVALGTFYTYFDSKEALFAALVEDMSAQVREQVAPALAEASGAIDREQRALSAYLRFVAEHKEVYRIIDEAEFVDPAGFRRHYETTAARIAARLEAGAEAGELKDGDRLTTEIRAWAMMGMNVFLGLRFGVWSSAPPERVAEEVARLLAEGLNR